MYADDLFSYSYAFVVEFRKIINLCSAELEILDMIINFMLIKLYVRYSYWTHMAMYILYYTRYL